MKTKIIFVLLLYLPFLVTAQVKVIQNGNVGIGIDTPSEKLDVDGNITMNGSATITAPDGGYHQIKANSYGGTYGVVINYPGEVLRTPGGQEVEGAIIVTLKSPGTYWVDINLALFDYTKRDNLTLSISGIHYSSGSFRIIGREIIAYGDWNAEEHTDLIRFGKNSNNEGVMIIGAFTDYHGGGPGPATYAIKSIQVTKSTFKSEEVELSIDNNASNYTIDETYTDRLNDSKHKEIVTGLGNASFDYIRLQNRNFEEFGGIYHNLIPNSFGDGDDLVLSASGNRDLNLQTYGGNINFLNGGGKVGVGTFAPAEKLHVIGNIKASGSVIASCGTLSCSDMRYKKNFKKLENPLTKIHLINGMYYDWDKEAFPDKGFDDKTYLGFKAQEVEQQFPEVVHTDTEGYKSVDYSRMTVVLLEAMKEQQKQIAALQHDNEVLKNQMADALKYIDNQSGNASVAVSQDKN